MKQIALRISVEPLSYMLYVSRLLVITSMYVYVYAGSCVNDTVAQSLNHAFESDNRSLKNECSNSEICARATSTPSDLRMGTTFRHTLAISAHVFELQGLCLKSKARV